MKSFPRMLNEIVSVNAKSAHAYNFRKLPQIKMQFSSIIEISEKRQGSHLTGPKGTPKKMFTYLATKKLVPCMLSLRENVRTSKFWQKSK
jgi:hypothetical protein